MSDPSATGSDPRLPPRPPSNFRRFIIGVLIGTGIINGATLLVGATGEGIGGYFLGLILAAATAIAFHIGRNKYGAGGLWVSLLVSPLLAYPSCALTFNGF